MIRVGSSTLNGNEEKYVVDCLRNNQLSNGPYLHKFEKAFGEFIGTKYALAASSGTTALHLTMLGLDIKPGDEVISPVMTYIASANAAKYCGATPVFVDCDYSWNMSVDEIKKKITPKTKAIIVVHLYGRPAEIDDILDLATDNDIPVIEDAAEALGSSYKGQMTGSMGLAGIFSLFPNKIVTSAEGGVIVTNDEKLYDKMLLFRGQGVSPTRRYWHEVLGYNYRITDVASAIGLAQLEKIEWHIARRCEVYDWYFKRLIGNNKIEFQPDCLSNRTFLRWMVTIELAEGIDRDGVIKKLEENGIESRPVFPLLTWMPMYKSEERFPIAERISKQGLCLPTHASLSEEDIDLVCETLTKIIG